MDAEQLKAILDAHLRWLHGEDDGKRANLSRANLSEENLSEANLSRADLSGANLSEANLSWANLSEANLSEADLSWANLSEADLSRADISRANLSEADLSRADLSWANLSEAKGTFDAAKWIADNLERARGGVYAYKTFGSHYKPPAGWKIKAGAVITEVVNPLPTLDCACGVNVATLKWVKRHGGSGPIWKLIIRWEDMAGGVIPWNTDGKFRVPRAKLVEVVA